MSLFFNGEKTGRVFFDGTQTGRDFFNGTQVFASEESFTPSWSLSGTGWTDTTWGSWSVGRNEGDRMLGIAETTKNINGHSKLRITPTGLGLRAARTGGIRILINGALKFEMTDGATRTSPVEIDLTGYSGDVTIRVELEATWGYSDMYNDTTLVLHD